MVDLSVKLFSGLKSRFVLTVFGDGSHWLFSETVATVGALFWSSQKLFKDSIKDFWAQTFSLCSGQCSDFRLATSDARFELELPHDP